MAAKDFNTALREAGMGRYIRPSTGSPTRPTYTPRHTNAFTKSTQRYQRVVRPATPIWPEYNGGPTLRPFTYSPAMSKARSQAMDALVKRCDAILNNAYKPDGY